MKTKKQENHAWTKRKTVALAVAVLFTVFTLTPCPVFAETVQLEGGSVDIETQGDTTNWKVTGNPVWNVAEFNVAQNSIYNISGLTGGASLALLVNGGSPTEIIGKINLSELTFILQNIAGIHIGSTGSINLSNAALIASTLPLNLSAADFLKQSYQFNGQGGILTNEGRIVGGKADLVALIANAIENRGVIDVPMGTVALAAGKLVTVGISGDGLISIGVDEATANELGLNYQIENAGMISSKGGRILLSAKAIDGLFDKAIRIAPGDNATSIIVADNGTIEFVAQGDISNYGMLQARNGSILVSASGDFETKGSLETLTLSEKAASFRIGGDYLVGESFHDNLDNAITYAANANITGTINDVENVIISAGVTLTLKGNTTFAADSDVNGTGAFLMDPTAAIVGGGKNLTIKASQASTLGSISNVAIFILQESKAGSAPTYTADPTTTTWSNITDFRIAKGKLSRFTGSGTSEAPYMIYDVYGLQAMPGYLFSSFKLANNINASSTSGWNAGAGFASIGSGSPSPFSGMLDGDSKTVSGLTINRPGVSYSGLFGYISGATIQNIGMTDVGIVGGTYSGGLVGCSRNSNITQAYASGSVLGLGDYVGGLAGFNFNNATITNSYSSVSVTGGARVGGLVGGNDGSAVITGSYATGIVNGGERIGGLVGYNTGSSSIINSYSTGSVNGTSKLVGGLVGWNNNGSFIINSYSTSAVTGSGDCIGGLAGENYGSTITGSYAIGTVIGNGNEVGGLVGANSVEGLITDSYYVGSITGRGDHVGGLVGYNRSSSIVNSYVAGTVTGGDYDTGGLVGMNCGSLVGTNYIISTIAGSYAAGSVAGDDFVGGLIGWNLGSIVIDSHFSGSVSGGDRVGGFVGGNSDEGLIADSYAAGSIAGENYVGGFAGENFYATITGSYVSGSVSGDKDYVGGFAGKSSVANIADSYASTSVSGRNSVGGLIGWNYGAAVSNTYTTGAVNANGDEIGGLVGTNSDGSSIANSYASSIVNGKKQVGGLVGRNIDSSITNSYAVGAAFAKGNGVVGGLIGTNVFGVLTNAWWYNAVNSSGVGSGPFLGVTKTSAAAAFYPPTHPVYAAGTPGQWDRVTPVWDFYVNELPKLHFENHVGSPYALLTGNPVAAAVATLQTEPSLKTLLNNIVYAVTKAQLPAAALTMEAAALNLNATPVVSSFDQEWDLYQESLGMHGNKSPRPSNGRPF
jgi:hypothetical protein